jgi:hypothetical protein
MISTSFQIWHLLGDWQVSSSSFCSHDGVNHLPRL